MTVIKQLYNRTVRPFLPRKYGVFAGVPARQPRLLDQTEHHPHYKQGLLSAIDQHVDDGDRVELIGFGRGVSTVHLLRAGASRVIAHDAAPSMLEIGWETLRINTVDESRVTVRHSLVGEDVKVSGDPSDAERVPPSQLSEADVLVLDCEGAERSILQGLGTLPPTVVVETHPEWGVPADASRAALEADYELRVRQYEPGRSPEKQVLVGVRE